MKKHINQKEREVELTAIIMAVIIFIVQGLLIYNLFH